LSEREKELLKSEEQENSERQTAKTLHEEAHKRLSRTSLPGIKPSSVQVRELSLTKTKKRLLGGPSKNIYLPRREHTFTGLHSFIITMSIPTVGR